MDGFAEIGSIGVAGTGVSVVATRESAEDSLYESAVSRGLRRAASCVLSLAQLSKAYASKVKLGSVLDSRIGFVSRSSK